MLRSSAFQLPLLATAWVVVTSCALKPVESPPAAARDNDCVAANPLHMVSTSSTSKPAVDPEIESLLTQRTRDARLRQINRGMYQSLHSLDVELRREQAIAACKQRSLSGPILEAQAITGSHSSVSSSSATNALAPVGSSGSGSSAASSSVASPSSLSSQGGGAGTSSSGAGNGSGGQISALRKASVSPAGAGGGNGATAPKFVPGSDNDIVARRLRKAAEAETDPTLRAKLWKEYMDYRQGTAVAK